MQPNPIPCYYVAHGRPSSSLDFSLQNVDLYPENLTPNKDPLDLVEVRLHNESDNNAWI